MTYFFLFSSNTFLDQVSNMSNETAINVIETVKKKLEKYNSLKQTEKVIFIFISNKTSQIEFLGRRISS